MEKDDLDDFMKRWHDILQQMVSTATQIMQQELETDEVVRGLAVYPMNNEEWAEYRADKSFDEPPEGMLS